MEIVKRTIAHTDCLFRQPIFTVAILAYQQAEQPIYYDTSRRWKV